MISARIRSQPPVARSSTRSAPFTIDSKRSAAAREPSERRLGAALLQSTDRAAARIAADDADEFATPTGVVSQPSERVRLPARLLIVDQSVSVVVTEPGRRQRRRLHTLVTWIERNYLHRRRQTRLGRSNPIDFETFMPPDGNRRLTIHL